MAITQVAVGTYAAGTTSVTPTNPSHASGDILVVAVHAKPTITATPPIFGTPAGWTPIVSGNDGSGTAQGTDAGQVWTASFYKVAASGAETNPACSVTNGNVCMAAVNSWRKTVTGSWSVQGVIAGDTTSATSWSTAHASMALTAGDAIDYRCGASGNASGGNINVFPTTATATATGFTFNAQTHMTAANTTNGTDMAASGYNWKVTEGDSGAITTTIAATLLASQKGCSVLIRLREPAPSTLTLTNTFEGGSNGTTITTGNSGGASGDAFNTVTINTNATLTFDNTHVRDTLAAKLNTPGPGTLCRLTWTSTSHGIQPIVYGRFYIWMDSNPASTYVIVEFVSNVSNAGSLRINTSGQIAIYDGSNAAQAASGVSIATSQWNRVEWQWNTYTNIPIVRLYNIADSSSHTSEVTVPSGIYLGPGDVSEQSMGIHSSGIGPIWLDDIGVSNVGWMGPTGTVPVTTLPSLHPINRLQHILGR